MMNDSTRVTRRPRRASPPTARIAAAIAAATAIAACGSNSLGSSSSRRPGQPEPGPSPTGHTELRALHALARGIELPRRSQFPDRPRNQPILPRVQERPDGLPTPAASKEPSPGRAVRADAGEAASAIELPARTWIPGHARPEAQPASTGRVARGQPLQRPLWGGRLLDRDPEGRRRTRRRVRTSVARMPRKPLTPYWSALVPEHRRRWRALPRLVRHHQRRRAAPIAPPARTRQSTSRETREAEAALLGTPTRFFAACQGILNGHVASARLSAGDWAGNTR